MELNMDYDLDELLQELREKREQIEKDKDVSEKKLEDALNTNPSTDLGVTAILNDLMGSIEPNYDEKSVSAAVVETQQIDYSYNKAEKIIEIVTKKEAETQDQDSLLSSSDVPKKPSFSPEALKGDYTGDFVLGHADDPEDEKETSPEESRRAEAEKHPIFNPNQTTVKITIPDVKAEYTEEPSPVSSTGKIKLTAEEEIAASKTILNTSSEEDDFSEFFGDKVVVEHSDTKYRTRKIEKPEETEVKVDPEEEKMPQDAYDILFEQQNRDGRSVIIIGVAAFLTLFLNILLEVFNIPIFSSERSFYLANLILVLLVILADLKGFWNGLLSIFSSGPQPVALISISVVFSLLDTVASYLSSKPLSSGCVTLVSVFAYFFYQLGVFLDSKRLFDSYRNISESPQKYASLVLADSDFTHALTHDLNTTVSNVLIKRKVGRIDNFLSHANSKLTHGKWFSLLMRISGAVPVVLGILYYLLKEKNPVSAIRTAAVASCFIAPFVSSLCEVLPLLILQGKLSKVGTVLPGYSAAEEIANANCVVMEGRELFPKEKVLLHGIKTFEKERVDQAILYAASVLIHSCDTMSHMFMKVIQGKTDMLFDTDSVVYEEGLGFSFWVDKNRILVGRRELLETHEIEVPSRDYENRYTKASTRDAIYLAVAGKLYAMFVISYAPDEEMQSMLQELVKQDVNIIVRTRDFILSAEKIARMYDIPRTMVTIVRESAMPELARKTEYTSVSSSSMTHGGSASSFLKGVIGCNRLLQAVDLASVLEMVCNGLGVVLALILTLIGSIVTTSASTVLLFQLAWTLLVFLILSFKKM